MIPLLIALAFQASQPAPPHLPSPTTAPAAVQPDDGSGKALASKIMSASGVDVWPSVKRLRFTFNVADGEKTVLSARHDWNLREGTDLVTVGDKTMTAYFPEKLATLRLDEEASKAHEQAWKRWTNDAYWLLMPLKLLDVGTKLSPVVTTRDNPASIGRMTLSFDGVGLTPGDQYDLTVDLRTNQIVHWFYRPGPDRRIGFTWEKYQMFNGLTLATEHVADEGGRRIFFTDIEVERE